MTVLQRVIIANRYFFCFRPDTPWSWMGFLIHVPIFLFFWLIAYRGIAFPEVLDLNGSYMSAVDTFLCTPLKNLVFQPCGIALEGLFLSNISWQFQGMSLSENRMVCFLRALLKIINEKSEIWKYLQFLSTVKAA